MPYSDSLVAFIHAHIGHLVCKTEFL